ncbi:MAG: hypothetical protein WCK10_01465, partial [Candidatus Staskawiczbacteria bacterium]
MMFKLDYKKFLTITALVFSFGIFFCCGSIAKAANVGDITYFNVDKGFDAGGRTQISASLVKISSRIYFYIEKVWLDSQTQAKQAEILAHLDTLSNEFDSNIYPTLNSVFGSEWTPGIDKDSRITVLFESINSNEGGYFRETDEYEKIQLPSSNEREMVYLSASIIDSPNIKAVLAHEFTHLITF